MDSQADKDIDPENDDILRVEWAKSRARAGRMSEEVLLLREEMRRVLAFLAWKGDWWSAQGSRRTCKDKGLAEGLSAYASKQAAVQRSLFNRFRRVWEGPLTDKDKGLPYDVPQGKVGDGSTKPNTDQIGDDDKDDEEDDEADEESCFDDDEDDEEE